MNKTVTCINCPIGCQITVTLDHNQVVDVTGFSCKRGLEYAKAEAIAPVRMVTAAVKVNGEKEPLSVKTENPIPKEKIFDCIHAIRSASPQKPIHIGDVICRDVCGTGINVIATKEIV